MICLKCGSEVPEGARFCDKCGSVVEEVQKPQQEQTATVNDFNYTSPSTQGQQVMAYGSNSSYSQVFVESDEQLLATLGNGWITNMLFGRTKKCNALLTDKRVYLQGIFFSGQGKSLLQEKYEKIIDLEDITGTGFLYSTGIGILLTLLVVFVPAILGFILSGGYRSLRYGYLIFSGAGMGLLLGILVATIIYILSRKTYFIIEYAGGSIRFEASIIGVSDVRDFQKQIRRAKDRVKRKL